MLAGKREFSNFQNACDHHRHVVAQPFDLVAIVRRHQHRPLPERVYFQNTPDKFIPHQRIEPAERLVEHAQLRPIRQRRLHRHTTREIFQLPILWQRELHEQRVLQHPIPRRIERPAIVQELPHRHPDWQRLVLRHVADLRLLLPAKFARIQARIQAKHPRRPTRRLDHVHEPLDRRRFTRAIGPEQRKDTPLRDRAGEPVHHLQLPEPSRELRRFNAVHGEIPPPSAPAHLSRIT